MLGMSPPKRNDCGLYDGSGRRSTEMHMVAEVRSRSRMSPTGTDWRPPRNRGTSVASSVTSMSSPRSSDLTDAAIEHMLNTIEEQERAIQSCRRSVVKKMREVEQAVKKEEELRAFLEQCRTVSQEQWSANKRMQSRNEKLKEKLAALGEAANNKKP